MSDSASPKAGINGWSPEYLESLYEAWKGDPESVDLQWQHFFSGFELARSPHFSSSNGTAPIGEEEDLSQAADQDRMNQFNRVASLVYHYRDIGHLWAALDPIGRERVKPKTLELSAFKLNDADLDREFTTTIYGFTGLRKLGDIIKYLEDTYCGHFGVEYLHIQNTKERRWIQQAVEPTRGNPVLSVEEKRQILRLLHDSSMFENFLHTRYPGQKRFSLEGSETLIPMLAFALEAAGDLGVEESVIGMAHRGRLNVLSNVLGKDYDDIFAEFEDNYAENLEGGGDVKYHRGYSSTYRTRKWKELHLTLTANPSHLEAVDPVVGGRARAKQRILGDAERKRVVPILIHGDAAFAGQGIVAECLQMANLPGYRTGGTVHLIVNNQIGFTTDPIHARSTVYCTDVAKMIQAPIFHVNGDDPEVCAWVVKIAIAYRQVFGKDVVVDMWCYRKHGHNEGDEPAFTQPKMYELIRKLPNVTTIYRDQLLGEGVIDQSEVDRMRKEIEDILERAQLEGKELQIKFNQTGFKKIWKGIERNFSFDPVKTAVAEETIRRMAERLGQLPDGFRPHRKLVKLIENRRKAVLNNEPMDWGTVEALCYGSLLLEECPVRLTGQDSQRGTFSHRHAVLTDVNTEEEFTPLNNLGEGQAKFCIYDSPLAEASVVGFEYGYSLGDPQMLIIWEAQFGDFVNGAQVIIDQFIVSAEAKWDRSSGLVLLLPHGYEGQGPEHSSARLERFLQACSEENIQVANPTTPAQFFHLMRRQVKSSFRKPLIVMSPKSLLRHSKATSLVEELTGGTFQEVLDDPEIQDRDAVTRLVLCSGKVYYDLRKQREEAERWETAILRVEQLYPLHTELLDQVLSRYPNARHDITWCQEEPKNMGAWMHMSDWVHESLGIDLRYAGRQASPTTAVGSKAIHDREIIDLLLAAFPPVAATAAR